MGNSLLVVRDINHKYIVVEGRYLNMNKKEQEFLVQKIRTQYTEREHTQLDELKNLILKLKNLQKYSLIYLARQALSSWEVE